MFKILKKEKIVESLMESPILVAISVFISIYIVWYLIRLFADFILVGIALGSAALAYNIHQFYPEFKMVLEESNILNVIHATLPQQLNADGVIVIISLIIFAAVLVSIPFLPFSATYRIMFGVENPVFFRRKEAKVRSWIYAEIERHDVEKQLEQEQAKLPPLLSPQDEFIESIKNENRDSD